MRNDTVGFVRDLYIFEVDDVAKTFSVRYTGAPKGTYYFTVTSKAYTETTTGKLAVSAIAFVVDGSVIDISPKQGSVYGGTLLTITGTGFSTGLFDQVVKVSDFYCDILTATNTVLTCRIRPTGLTAADVGTVGVLVALAGS